MELGCNSLVDKYLLRLTLRKVSPYLSVFSPNAGKYGPEKTCYLDTFHAVCYILNVLEMRYVPCG